MKKAMSVLILALVAAVFAGLACAEEITVWPEDFTRSNALLGNMTLDPVDETYLSYWEECEQPGTVVPLEYDTYFYALDAKNGDALSHETPVTKTAYVYLPYGYDETKEYDILYLMHGMGLDEGSWFSMINNNDRAELGQGTAVHLLDNMIANGDMKPCIIVTPTFYTLPDQRVSRSVPLMSLIDGFALELPQLMEAVESTYSTYAADTTRDAFIASRDHRGFAGLSMGAMTTWQVAVAKNLDIFGWIGTMSSGAFPDAEDNPGYFADTLVPALKAAKENGWPLHMLLNFNGTTDMLIECHVTLHNCFLDYMAQDDYLVAGENYDFVLTGGPHSWDYWDLYLYDMMPVFFK